MTGIREVSEEDLTVLERFLMSERAPAECMQLSDLDGFLTGMMAAVCGAFRPQWLATWADRLYIVPPQGPR